MTVGATLTRQDLRAMPGTPLGTIEVVDYTDMHTVMSTPTDHAGYWVSRSSGRLHRVARVRVLWAAVGASYSHPRICTDLVCTRYTGTRAVEGLRVWPLRSHPCPKCFPLGMDDPGLPPKTPIRVTL